MKTSMDTALERVKLGRRIAKDALALGQRLDNEAAMVSPWLYVQRFHPGKYANDMLHEANSAIIAEVLAAYRESDSKDISQVISQPRARAFLQNLQQGGLSYEDASANFAVAYHQVHFDEMGRHHYKVSDGLGVLLALTELRGLHVEDLKMPFPSVFIEVPAEVGFKVRNDVTGWHPVEGIFIAEDSSDDGTRSNPSARTPGRCWRLCVMSQPYYDQKDLDSAQALFTLPLVAGDSVDQAVDRLRQGQTYGAYNADVENWVTMWKWAMNVMVYATTPDAEADHIRDNPDAESIWRRVQKLPPGKKKDALKDKLKGMDQKPRVLLGKSVRLTPQVREMKAHHDNVGGPGVLRVRTLVSGHWMRYHVGKGRTDIVWKFRSPFWRGPEDAPVSPTTDHVLR